MDTMKAVLTEKFIALNNFIKKFERSHTRNLTTHVKAEEQKKGNTSKRRTLQKIIKLGI